MANIDSELNTLATAIYGEQVRGSIYSALEKVNNDVENMVSDTQKAEIVEDLIEELTDQDTAYLIIDGNFF